MTIKTILYIVVVPLSIYALDSLNLNNKFKKNRDLIHNGRYYRLSNATEDDFALWEFVKDGKALVQGMIFNTEPNLIHYCVKLKGLDANKKYKVNSNGCYTGAALMYGGFLLNIPRGDYYGVELYVEEI